MDVVETERETIVNQLQMLNRQVARQNSLGRRFLSGVVYGIGFFVGSAIIATIALGVLGQFFVQVPWVHTTFEAGATLLKH
jgi:threonine/homoserine/homoserine lactone efflux protein